MKTGELFFKAACLVTTVAMLTGCTADIVQDGERNKETNATTANVTFTSENPPTRTNLTHSIGKGATAFWSEKDKIWAKDVNNQWKQSGKGTFSDDKSNGVFSFSSGTFANNCEVHYTGVNGTRGDRVTIAAKQMQSKANDFHHAGVSGDCATGIAKGNGEKFKFRLSHKSSYLCFLPFSPNEKLVKNGKLIKIEVISKNNIAGTYDFSNGTLSNTPISDGSKTITLTTGDGFTLEQSTKIDKNGSYIVIAPGNHTLTVRYWLHYKTYTEDITGTVTKTFTLNCEAGKIYDIKAKLEPTDYTPKKYYMWDCTSGYDYWKGYEKYQPKTKYAPAGSFYPTSVNDPRWYNQQAFPTPAKNSCSGCPNVNETWWFIQYGDPHWDSEELWIMYGYLYTGGMWFKRKDYIVNPAFSSTSAPDGKNYATQAISAYYENKTAAIGRPNDIQKYFYLPALGYYNQGKFYNIGEDGNYWTSTPTPWNNSPGTPTKGAYYLFFYPNTDGRTSTAALYGGENRQKGFTWWKKE